MADERLQPTLASLLSSTSKPFVDRDLSWLQFNMRVLGEARDHQNPLVERAKFLSISSSNLDEFFMIRFSSINRKTERLQKAGDLEGYQRTSSIRAALLREVAVFGRNQLRTLGDLDLALASYKARLPDKVESEPETQVVAKEIFSELIFPHLTAPTPYKPKALNDLLNLQMALVLPQSLQWCPIPKTLPQSYLRKGKDQIHRIFFLDELLQQHYAEAFGLVAQPVMALRLTRDGDFTADLEEEDSESIPDIVRTEIKRRDLGRPARIQYSLNFAHPLLVEAAAALKVDADQCLPAARTLCLSALWSALNQLPDHLQSDPQLYFPTFKPLIPPQFASSQKLSNHLKKRDLLLHHPYDSFDAFVEWVRMACEDPKTTSIQMTVYRTDAVSPVTDLLKKAASKKKKVRVLIELRARFDELNNLRLTEELRKAGVTVAFGFGKLKLHAKIALVTREVDGVTEYLTHLSTGNYNAATSRQYTDLAILSASPEVGADALHFFDSAADGKVPTQFKKLLSAPTQMHRKILSLIEGETKAAIAGQKARIFAKVNALVDESVIEKLYQASNSGVKVDLVVRGACSLIPGVKGMSENIRVYSIVDRFLEHSRIYAFESSGVTYLSSADWMPRNFFSRLELAFPVLDERIKKYIHEFVIPSYMKDNVKGRILSSKGVWKHRAREHGAEKFRAQYYFYDLARGRYQGTPLA